MGISAVVSPAPWVCTRSAYSYRRGCRCADCKRAHADRQDDYRQRAMDREVPAHVHGTTMGYQFFYCRCERCKAAKSAENARRPPRK